MIGLMGAQVGEGEYFPTFAGQADIITNLTYVDIISTLTLSAHGEGPLQPRYLFIL